MKFLLALRFVFLTQQQRLNCVDVFISMRTASAAAQTLVDCSELHQQPIDAVLRPTIPSLALNPTNWNQSKNEQYISPSVTPVACHIRTSYLLPT